MIGFKNAQRETLEAYDALAADMAEWQWSTDFSVYLRPFAERLSGRQQPVLDAGCGTGRDVAALTSLGVRSVGVDLSMEMLRMANQRVDRSMASWVRADMQRLPFGSGAVGGVWSNASLLHLDPAALVVALGEFRRVLSLGSPLFISTLAGKGSSVRETANDLRRWFWAWDEPTLSRLIRRARFDVISADEEPGVVRGRWVNILAVAT